MGIYRKRECDDGLDGSQGKRITGGWSPPTLTNGFPDVTDAPLSLLFICLTWHCVVASKEQEGLQTGSLAPFDCQKLEREDTKDTSSLWESGLSHKPQLSTQALMSGIILWPFLSFMALGWAQAITFTEHSLGPDSPPKAFVIHQGQNEPTANQVSQRKRDYFPIIYLILFPVPICKNSTKSSFGIEIPLSSGLKLSFL